MLSVSPTLVLRYHDISTTAVQSQKEVTAYFLSEQLLLVGFAELYTRATVWDYRKWVHGETRKRQEQLQKTQHEFPTHLHAL